MRYGLFVVMAGRQAGGPETYERSLVRALAELDRENTYRIYCLSREAADAVRVDQDNFSFRILRPSIRWISIPLSLPLALARDGVELYHATFTPPPFSPKPYVFTHHCFSTFNHPEFYDPLILARLNRLLLTGLKKARRILCVSQNVLDLTAERLGISPNRMEVVYHGIEEQFHPMDKAAARQWAKQRCGISRPFVLFVGRLDARKNVARLIEAYHRFRQESLCDWPLVLAGRRGWQAGQIDAAIERLDARAYVIEAGYLRHEELPLLYNAAEMFFFPRCGKDSACRFWRRWHAGFPRSPRIWGVCRRLPAGRRIWWTRNRLTRWRRLFMGCIQASRFARNCAKKASRGPGNSAGAPRRSAHCRPTSGPRATETTSWFARTGGIMHNPSSLRSILSATAIVLASLSCCLFACAGESAPSVSAAAAAPADDYLPLQPGVKWTLRTPAPTLRDKPVVLEVVAKDDAAYRIRFTNPWNSVEWVLIKDGSRIYMKAAVIGGTRADLPDKTLYFDLSASDGASWSNAIGKIKVEGHALRVQTPAGTFDRCIRFRETTKGGDDMVWTLAPGVGFVQFGEGPFAFLLEKKEQAGTETPPPTSAPKTVLSAPPGTALRVRVGISDNPAAHVFPKPPNRMTPSEQKALLDNILHYVALSAQIGANGKYVSRRWDEIERRKGVFDFADVDSNFERAAAVGQSVELFTLRAPDTNNRSTPGDLSGRRFDEMRERLLALADALAPRLAKAGVRRVCLGNEIDAYFKNHKEEIEPFAALFGAARERFRRQIPGVQISATETFDGIADPELRKRLAPILSQTDFLSLTYYPLNPDFTMRPPDGVAADMKRMTEIAAELGLTGVVLQEVGYPSSPLNGSSEQAQAQFVAHVLEGLRTYPGTFEFANFFLMCDLPDWMVNDFSRYYQLGNSARFKTYLQTLGLHDGAGRPKKAWHVLEENLTGITGGTAVLPTQSGQLLQSRK